jgi:TonB family protein
MIGTIWLFARQATAGQDPQTPAEAGAVPPAPMPANQGQPAESHPQPAPAPPGTLKLRPAAPADQPGPDAGGNEAAPPAAGDQHPSPAPAFALHVREQFMPEIPKQAKELGIDTGSVVVVLHVNPKGTVDSVELVSATPPQVYDEDMRQVFEKWTFDPPGRPGRMTIEVQIRPQP